MHAMTNLALRTVCLAYKDFDPSIESDWNQLVSYTESQPSTYNRPSSSQRKQFTGTSFISTNQLGTNQLLSSFSSSPSVVPSADPSVKKPLYYRMETNLNCLGIAGMR